MATLTIRNLDDSVKRKLRVRAAERGVSMEEEARGILRDVLSQGAARSEDPPHAVSAPLEEPKGEWRLKASLEEILALGRKPDKPFDQKAASDELYSYLEDE